MSLLRLQWSTLALLLLLAGRLDSLLLIAQETPVPIAEAPAKSVAEVDKVDVATMDKALGVTLLGSASLWQEDAGDVARRLGWEKESETSTMSSYRLYATSEVRVCGARPYSCALYGRQGKVESLSLVFANSGDFEPFKKKAAARLAYSQGRVQTPDWDEEKDRTVEKAFAKLLDADKAAISGALVAVLGEARSELFGGSMAARSINSRWDWKDVTFLLEVKRRGYVCLRVVPKAMADESKGDQRLSGRQLQSLLLKNVAKRGNGDVVVTQVPMVDQGPKGYCLPATWERYLRYIGISSDMYLLALSAGTEDGGGTSTYGALAAVEDSVYHAGRRIESVPSPVSIPGVGAWVDKGLPIMFACRINPAFDEELYLRARDRAATPNAGTWKTTADGYRAKAKDANPGDRNHHMRMIIGYNAGTNEVAITDSWGPPARERWITVEEANAMGDGYMVAVDF